ncbi:hypothetical protein BRAO375_1140008 [Bradyrhizobium sp. ORS 375]|nr:hypothetical protein BRAO375_1140008 [Bradyrhizobium sp. ORS 375]
MIRGHKAGWSGRKAAAVGCDPGHNLMLRACARPYLRTTGCDNPKKLHNLAGHAGNTVVYLQ